MRTYQPTTAELKLQSNREVRLAQTPAVVFRYARDPGICLLLLIVTYFRRVQPELVNHSTAAFAEEVLQARSSAMIHF